MDFSRKAQRAVCMAELSRASYMSKERLQKWLAGRGFTRMHIFDDDDLQGDTQGFVASTETTCVIIFRGTEPRSLTDWETDANFAQIEKRALGGKVHLGFYDALLHTPSDEIILGGTGRVPSGNLWCNADYVLHAAIEQEAFPPLYMVGDDLDDNSSDDGSYKQNERIADPIRNVYVGGHSLGGALAVLFCAWLPACYRLSGLYTYGQPNVGDSGFINKLVNRLNYDKTEIFRCVNKNDIVPRIPSASLELFHGEYRDGPGRCQYIDQRGAVCDIATCPRLYSGWMHRPWRCVVSWMRGGSMWKRLTGVLTPSFVLDHSSEEYVRLLERTYGNSRSTK